VWSLAFATILFTSAPSVALAWGGPGHRIVARIAWANLTPTARARVASLLANDPYLAICEGKNQPVGTPFEQFVCIANWADDVRDDRPETRNWHFVDIPLNKPTYLASRDCAPGSQGDCVISEVERAFRVLSNPNANAASRNEALKFIVHFIGDMHQPLHDATDTNDPQAIANGFETDRGGNLKFVQWLGQKTNNFGDNWNLHAVWDTGILAASNVNETQLAFNLKNGLTADQIAFGQPTPVAANWPATLPQLLIDWAQAGHALAVNRAYQIGPRFNNDIAIDAKSHKKFPRFHLGPTYLNNNKPIVASQLRFASVRLARILNEALR